MDVLLGTVAAVDVRVHRVVVGAGRSAVRHVDRQRVRQIRRRGGRPERGRAEAQRRLQRRFGADDVERDAVDVRRRLRDEIDDLRFERVGRTVDRFPAPGVLGHLGMTGGVGRGGVVGDERDVRVMRLEGVEHGLRLQIVRRARCPIRSWVVLSRVRTGRERRIDLGVVRKLVAEDDHEARSAWRPAEPVSFVEGPVVRLRSVISAARAKPIECASDRTQRGRVDADRTVDRALVRREVARRGARGSRLSSQRARSDNP